MAKGRRTFDEEFKRNAVRMVADGCKIRSVAKELGVTDDRIRKWGVALVERHNSRTHTTKEYEAATPSNASTVHGVKDDVRKPSYGQQAFQAQTQDRDNRFRPRRDDCT